MRIRIWSDCLFNNEILSFYGLLNPNLDVSRMQDGRLVGWFVNPFYKRLVCLYWRRWRETHSKSRILHPARTSRSCPSPRLWSLWSSARRTRRQLLTEKHATHSIIRATDFPQRKRETERKRERARHKNWEKTRK